MDLVLGNLLSLRTLSESVFESARHCLQVFHASGSVGSTSLSFCSPIVSTHLFGRITTGRANALLDVEGSTSASTARRVRFAGSLSETGGSFRLLK